MPLHFQSIIDEGRDPDYMAWLLTEGMDDIDSIFVSPDKFIHAQKNIIDSLSGVEIGKLIYTMKVDDEKQAVLVLDLDIILLNSETATIQINRLLEGSSDSNEYYEAETIEEGGHFELETVNRYTVEGNIEGSKRDVYLSAFPFELTVFPDMDAFNKYVGFSRVINVANTGIMVGGLSEKFIMPGGLFSDKKKPDDHYSMVVGRVRSFQDVRWEFGEYKLDFVIAKVDTALGRIPVAMGRSVFDLATLTEGSVIGMNADIKTDLSKPEDFTNTKP